MQVEVATDNALHWQGELSKKNNEIYKIRRKRVEAIMFIRSLLENKIIQAPELIAQANHILGGE